MTTLTLTYPTTLHSLLDDAQYLDYFSRYVKLHPTPAMQPRWLIMAQANDGTWKRGLKESFISARRTAEKLLGTPEIRDLSIIARPKIFKEPSWMARLTEPGDEWCGRCRRPSRFIEYNGTRHPAIPTASLIVDNMNRCYFCGLREGFK